MHLHLIYSLYTINDEHVSILSVIGGKIFSKQNIYNTFLIYQ